MFATDEEPPSNRRRIELTDNDHAAGPQDTLDFDEGRVRVADVMEGVDDRIKADGANADADGWMWFAREPVGMEYVVLGWPDDGPKVRLDYEQFSYAGKFVMSNTGKAVARASRDSERPSVKFGDETVVAAIAFNEDRTDDGTVWFRYVTVHADRRGEGIGPELARFTTARVHDRGYRRVKIAVNNPFAYQALYHAGFGFTGEETGIAELVLEHPKPTQERYQAGLDCYRERELSPEEEAFLASKKGASTPEQASDDGTTE